MLRTILNAFSVADIRKKIAFTAAMLALYRLGAYIPAPGVDTQAAGASVRLGPILDQILAEVRETTSPSTWACFEGRILRDRPATELASELGVSPNAVYVNACRVRARVREHYTRHPQPTDWS